MCIICTEWEKGKMTSEEAYRALGELILFNGETSEENKHYFEVSDKILNKEVPLKDSDTELDSLWEKQKE